ncbi:MAG: 16S rRNA (cytosine(1402)-N(4))-methyltransferase RsmH [Planctomycetota bacterium]|jgi:16S rRNA (cytosine1402-N4)-methyltransferase|nr:16S rRNA (cytosine(1402)-N(4))-methyltransferase RsmH [Planctomycetota bacterium]
MDAAVPGHLPVMPAEVMDVLAPRPGDTAVDGTTGLGGHSLLLGPALGGGGRLVCFDRDAQALALARFRLAQLPCRTNFVNMPFEFMDRELRRLGVAGADRILLDLGVSSLQLDSPERGFSFMRDGPLDMRMSRDGGPTARDIVNAWPEERLRLLFSELGEERFSRRLAKCIVEGRAGRPIETTGELSELALRAAPRLGRAHPATRMFQALRMYVNDELGCISRGLAAAGRVLPPGGRLAVLTFHSLEDRLVKRIFKRWLEMGLVEMVLSGATVPSRDEIRGNPRARSAKLRAVERLN